MTDKVLFTPFTADNHPIPGGILDDYTEQEKADYANEWAVEHMTEARRQEYMIQWLHDNAPPVVVNYLDTVLQKAHEYIVSLEQAAEDLQTENEQLHERITTLKAVIDQSITDCQPLLSMVDDDVISEMIMNIADNLGVALEASE